MSCHSDSTTARQLLHCLLCHRDMDGKAFRSLPCKIKHVFERDFEILDLAAPSGATQSVAFAQCCDAIRVITTKELRCGANETKIEYPWGGEYCYSGRHIIDPNASGQHHNGTSLINCRALKCATYQPAQRVRLLEEYMAELKTGVSIKWSRWAREDAEIVRWLKGSLPATAARGIGPLVIEGEPYKVSRVIRAREYFTDTL
ncbi:hypothetical protein FRC04_003359 [Tulasnella sp. 424]|nr:hypothetical protein FRC04_003359 [Tulasnella sp. 424]KAG8977174.1 hypothetical protein FRC05_002173 [Tulasnella sp. 425]